MAQTRTAHGAIDHLVYCSYRHNRTRRPDIHPDRWSAVFDDAAALEARYLREQTCPLCLRTGEQMIDGYCWRCTALATERPDFEDLDNAERERHD